LTEVGAIWLCAPARENARTPPISRMVAEATHRRRVAKVGIAMVRFSRSKKGGGRARRSPARRFAVAASAPK
jgi:hypothetical protein